MAKDGSTTAVVAAVFGNLTLAVLKLAAFAVSGSGAMLSEAIHSIADTTNQALLYLGIRLSERPADERHPYGYGAERYFWSLVSAMGIFILGAGVTVYHGVRQLMDPHEVHATALTWIVLGLAVVVDGAVFLLALRVANQQREDRSWLTFYHESRDPALLAVLLEDGIAVIGVGVAALGIWLSLTFGAPVFDALASIIIGVLLGGMAIVLALRNRELLLGQAADPRLEKRIRELVSSDPVVGKVLRLRTRVLSADAYAIDLQVDFDVKHIVEHLQPEIEAAAGTIKTTEDLEKFAFNFAESVVDQLAREVDRLEARIQEAVPSVRMIDVEGD